MPSTEYAERQTILCQLGFASYKIYLFSPLWESIRSRLFQLYGPRCYACGKRGGQVHHARYTVENMSGASLDGLLIACRKCHGKAHRGPKTFFGSEEATRRLEARRLKQRRRRQPSTCPRCHINRAHKGGACPPCRRILERDAAAGAAPATLPGERRSRATRPGRCRLPRSG